MNKADQQDNAPESPLLRVAHGLYGHLTCIQGFTELLLHRRFGAAQRQEMLTSVYSSVLRLERTLADVIELEYFDRHAGTHLTLSRQALAPLMQMAVAAWVPANQRHRLNVAAPESAPLVEIDGEKFLLALGHLLANALLFSPPDSEIALDIIVGRRPGKHEVGIRVRDQGIGMNRSEAAQAFDRFYRVDPHAANRGAGLGLALVREIMAAQQGRVSLTSSKGKGTTVTLWLPCSVLPHPGAK